ncbi:hypothetical protein BGW36DRAFT_422739 [Talaromyces proteolyticus]|uniref:Uncharacterized protein n=1 Tax=Talaromyces proteolyticus TaxID=1131652 RepID=A0AAD4L2T3_9EURO|nr:uncharacterized protein BGW36DRAFT_422739 [Talaromyces proteolyticus]KAH8703168.1 hypothetical protein BGW36DRAFT_422739 [Talaromyces proteolyticus]
MERYELVSDQGRNSLGPSQNVVNDTHTTWSRGPTRLRRYHVSILLLDLLCVAAAIPFYILIGICVSRNGDMVDDSDLNRMQEGLYVSATLFPLVFTAVAGRLRRRLGEWRLERGGSILVLEQINRSSTFMNSVLTQITLRKVNILGIILLTTWAFSPVGGQSPLHVLSTTNTVNSATQTLQYANLSTPSLLDGADDDGSFGGFVNTLYATSLLSGSKSIMNSSMDPFNNLKVPFLRHLKNRTDPPAWTPVPTGSLLYSSLTGVPITGLDKPGNTSFVMNSSYYDLFFSSKSKTDLNLNGSGIYIAFIPQGNSTNQIYPTWKVVLSPAGGSAQVSFAWTQIYVESQVMCTVLTTSGDQPACAVQAMRQINTSNPPFEMNSRTLELQIGGQWNSLLAFQNFSLSEAYLRYPQTPLEANLSDPSTASPSVDELEIGLAQLLNTYLYGSVDPMGLLGGTPTTPINTTGTRVYVDKQIYVVNFAWLNVFAVATTVLALCGLITIVLNLVSLNPEVLEDVGSLLYSPYLGLPAISNTIGGQEKTRLLQDIRIRLGDVQEHEPLGQLAIGTLRTTRRVNPGRCFE